MKAFLLAFALLVLHTHATQVTVQSVMMPVYLHGADEDEQIRIMSVPIITYNGNLEELCGNICRSFIPPSPRDRIKNNVNVGFEYGIRVSMEYAREKGLPNTIIINASAAKRPEGYPFTIEQVTESVTTCVKQMTDVVSENKNKVTIKVLPPPDSKGSNANRSEDRLEKETELFAARLAGTIWEKVGNFEVQRIRFDGAKLCALDYQNKPVVVWNSTQIHEPHRIHVDYSDGTSSWYFLDEDDKHLINCKVNRWAEYKPAGDGWKTETFKEFPTLRLGDNSIEIDQRHGKPTITVPRINAGSRLSEFTLPDGRLFWAFTSVNSRQLWLLDVRHVFGGRVCGQKRITQVRPTLPAELPEREKRMVDFIYQLREEEKWSAADTLSRELIRRSSDRTQAKQDYIRKLLGYASKTKGGSREELR